MIEKNIRINDICELVGGNTEKAWLNASFSMHPAPVNKANGNSISFCTKNTLEEAMPILENTEAKVIICSNKLVVKEGQFGEKIIIQVSNPRLAFITVMQRYFEEKMEWGIAPSAVIDVDAKIHPNSYIGPHVYIGKSEIGEGSIIHANVSIYSKVMIGKRVTVNSGTVIGADGFGYERNEDGDLIKFPNVAGVVIEDDVDIGSNTCIDRGTLDSTFIGRGTKIDNLCHIAHNVIIGKNCSVIAQSMIGGSVVIEDYSWVAPSACIRDGITIGKNSVVGLGAVVTKSVGENQIVMGVPAKPIRENTIPSYLKKKGDEK
ncbi:MAG: UDP-3-O-(3-hydroxymyristoyl)glucosamine N-acyltransferase [Euryarchaeota archaeon]|nr:UDP-3-O-(3-hydroxymyristoyl)glucosamine N-acyltransferase [Euryarchaeota archaeon]MBU4032162.1 UDP-3-O-(3-hydroxymyristoyl)glucosamine N-acyltransferase [Candidatus Thermoplasmatota archaeon]MBU4072298.1 UDP-3-O-(3-hydroxymyristoyl)glucosamine N-acyltransferase [Candidatus Thermoplasmatota archaeon]MBU4143854.1 UDP-3-O-(3-hydroxymyristoyl)glucosamine N-acyltransferase [Candidatus Thermoplasmatota archaeon]